MKIVSRLSMLLAFAMVLAGVQLFTTTAAHAQSSYFTSRGCADCHSTPVVASCNGCHYHGNRGLQATTSKTSYAPGETVSVTLTSTSTRSGWIKANLYNQSNALVASSTGNASGMGGSTTFPATLTAPAPTTPGTYTWRMAYYGNQDGTGTRDVHTEAAVSTNSFTVTAPVDATVPTVSAFTLPATATALTVPVSSLTASDNVAVTGYLITTSATKPLASAAGWTATAPTSVTAPAAGSVTFYAWAKDAAGNVSASRSATVEITLPVEDITKPVLTISTLDDGTITNNQTLNVSGQATDDVALQSVTVNGGSVQLDANGSFSTAVVLLDGDNVITVVATDSAGNSTTNARTITYVVSAPALSVTAPVDNLVSSQEILVVQGTVGELSSVTVSVNNGSPQVAALNGNVFTASVYLQPGLNTIAIESVDPAGVISSAKRTVFFDNGNPTVAIIEPKEDTIFSSPKITIKGQVADNDGAVTVQLTMGAKVYNPVVLEGKFEQKVTFAEPGQYTIVATATDEAGNEVSVSRNIIYKKGGKSRVIEDSGDHESDDEDSDDHASDDD